MGLGVHLSEPHPHLVLSPLPVESSGIQWLNTHKFLINERKELELFLKEHEKAPVTLFKIKHS